MSEDNSLVEAVARAIRSVYDAQIQQEADASDGVIDFEPGPWQEWEGEAIAAIAVLKSRNPEGWKCRAGKSAGANDPQDCNWPMCGCDPYADKVIAALEDSGAMQDRLSEPASDPCKLPADREAMIESAKFALDTKHGENNKIKAIAMVDAVLAMRPAEPAGEEPG